MQNFNGTTRSTDGTRASNPKDLHVDEVRISSIVRVPVSQLWTLNYTLTSSEAMTSGSRYYWKIRALDGGGEQ